MKAGDRLRSVVCEKEVIVVRPADGVDLRCGGSAMVALAEDGGGGAPDPAHAAGTLIGKRYADPASGLEVLCTKAGAGSLSLADTPLAVKEAKPLPSSD